MVRDSYPDPHPMIPHHYRCPRCAALLGADRDLTGRKVQCLGCRTVFTAGERTPAAEPDPPRLSKAPTGRRLLPFAVVGAVLALAGLALGIAALVTPDPPPADPGPVAQAPAEPPTEPGPGPPDVLPVSSEVALFVRPEPGQELAEDVPAPPTPRPTRPAQVPQLPSPFLPATGAPPPPTPKANPPAAPKPARPPEAKPAEPKRPDPEPVAPPAPPAGKDRFAAVDAHALAAPADAEATLPALARYLARGAKNDREKARAAYRWVTDRIAYDADALFAGRLPDPSPELTLQRRTGVCAGYANLFVDLCQKAGLNAAVVTGYAKGVFTEPGAPVTRPDHAWSAVKLDGRWCLVDATWGAGSVDGRQFRKDFTDYFFLTPPEQLAFTHLPEDPRWQMRQPPLTLDEFNRRPKVEPALFELGATAAAVERALADPNFREPVRTFRLPAPVTVTGELPIGRYLRAGTEYRFEFRADDAAAVAFIGDGPFRQLRRDGGRFRGTVRPPPGRLRIGVKPKAGDRGYGIILEYVVE